MRSILSSPDFTKEAFLIYFEYVVCNVCSCYNIIFNFHDRENNIESPIIFNIVLTALRRISKVR